MQDEPCLNPDNPSSVLENNRLKRPVVKRKYSNANIQLINEGEDI